MPEQSVIDNKVYVSSPQSAGRVDVAGKTIRRFYEMREARNQKFAFFRDRTVLEYVEDSVKRLNQHKEKPAYKKWWQANVAGSTTRNKFIGILSKLAAQMMEAKANSISDTSFIAKKKERVATALLKSANLKNQDDKQLILEMFEALSKGTVVGFEGWKFDERNVRVITDQDAQTGEVKFREETVRFWNDVYGQVWLLEDVFFGNIFVSNVQEMDDIILRTTMSMSQFIKEFGYYSDAGKVLPKSSMVGDESTIFYKPSDDLLEDEVEVLRYFNQITDEYILLANGVWINPMGKDTIMPLPFNHKKLPVWVAQAELIDSKFIYGKSLADKLMSDQDTEDKVWNGILDNLTMALQSPIVVQGVASKLTEGYLNPDQVIELEEGSLGKAERMNLGDNGSISMGAQIMDIIRNRMEQSSVSPEVLGSGGQVAKTATEVSIQREGALQIVSLFLRLMEFGERDKYLLRLQNIFQFYTMPSQKKEKELKYRRVVLKDEILSDGSIGMLDISFVPNVKEVVRAQERLDREVVIEEGVEKVVISPDFLRDAEMDVELIPRSSVKDSEALNQAKEVQFQKTVFAFYPDLANREALFADLVASYPEKNVDRLKMKKQIGQMGMSTEGEGMKQGVLNEGELLANAPELTGQVPLR